MGEHDVGAVRRLLTTLESEVVWYICAVYVCVCVCGGGGGGGRGSSPAGAHFGAHSAGIKCLSSIHDLPEMGEVYVGICTHCGLCAHWLALVERLSREIGCQW